MFNALMVHEFCILQPLYDLSVSPAGLNKVQLDMLPPHPLMVACLPWFLQSSYQACEENPEVDFPCTSCIQQLGSSQE